MTYAQEQREVFWKLFEKILKEKGEPFKIAYIHQIRKEITSFAEWIDLEVLMPMHLIWVFWLERKSLGLIFISANLR